MDSSFFRGFLQIDGFCPDVDVTISTMAPLILKSDSKKMEQVDLGLSKRCY